MTTTLAGESLTICPSCFASLVLSDTETHRAKAEDVQALTVEQLTVLRRARGALRRG